MSSHHNEESMDEEFLDEDKVIEIILELGNQILQSLGVEEKVDDVEVFLTDQFYIHFFEEAYPQIDFTQLKGAETQEEIAENIQTLIDLLGQKILNVDLEHIKGEEIVNGNPQHCINLLQLIYQLSLGIQEEGEGDGEGGEELEKLMRAQQERDEDEDEEDDDYGQELANQSKGKSGSKEKDRSKNNHHQQDQYEEDDEAMIIHERKRKAAQQQEERHTSNQKESQQEQSSTGKKHHQDSSSNKKSQPNQQQKRGRSHSDDGGDASGFVMKNSFQLEDDEEEEDDGIYPNKQGQNNGMNGQNQLEQEYDDEDGEFDEEDVKMYEQFLAQQQQQQQQQVQPKGQKGPQAQQQNQQPPQQQKSDSKKAPPPPMYQQEEEDDEEEFDDDEIDLDDVNPEILRAAEEMGITPQELFRQLRKQMEEEEDGSGPYMEDDEEEQEESQYSQGEIETRMKLLRQKSPSAPYLLYSYREEEPLINEEEDSQGNYDLGTERANSTTNFEKLKKQGVEVGEMIDDDDEDEDGRDGLGEEIDEETAQEIMRQQQQIMKQQQLQQQQQQNKKNYDSKISEVSKSKESSSYGGGAIKQPQQQIAPTNQHNQQQQYQQQQQQIGKPASSNKKQNLSDDMGNKGRSASNQKQQQQQLQMQDDYGEEEDEDEMEIDMSHQLKQLQQQKQQYAQQNEMLYGNEDDEDDDEDGQINEQDLMLIQQQLNQQQRAEEDDDEEGDNGEQDDEEDQDANEDETGEDTRQQNAQRQLQQQRNGNDDEEEEDEDDDKVLIDLNDLDDENRKKLVQYLHQVYQQNPDQFPFPQEVVQDLMQQWNQMELEEDELEEGESVKDIKSKEMIIEEVLQNQGRGFQQQPKLMGIEGGEQQIEDEGEDGQQEDDEDQDEMMELTEEQQQQLHQYLMIKQQQEQQQMQQQQEGADQDDDEEYEGQNQQVMQPHFNQSKQGKGAKKRGRSAGKKQKKPKQKQQFQDFPGAENMDPNLLHQIMLAQQQQQQFTQPKQLAKPTKKKSLSKAGRTKTSNLKVTAAHLPSNKPFNYPMRVLQPSTPGGAHFKSFNTNRSLSQKKKKRSAKKPKVNQQLLQQQQLQQQQLQMILQQQQQQQLLMQQQQMQQDQDDDEEADQMQDQDDGIDNTDGGQDQQVPTEMPVLNEEFLNQLSEEQLQALLEHQQQLMFQQQQQQQQEQMRNQQQQQQQLYMAASNNGRPQQMRSKSSINRKGTQAQKAAKVRASIYGGNAGFGGAKTINASSTYSAYTQQKKKRPTTAKNSKKPLSTKNKKKSKNVFYNNAGNQGVLLNNYFPALENPQNYGGMEGNISQATEEEGVYNGNTKNQRYPKFSTDNINNQNYMAGLNQDQIDEVPPEQEEGESQEFVQSHQKRVPQQQQYQGGSFGNKQNINALRQGHNPNLFAMNNMQNQQQDQDVDQDELNQDEFDDQNPLNQQDSQQETDQAQDHVGGQDQEGYDDQEEVQLSEEQLNQLLMNAHNLPIEQQEQLQLILQQKMKEGQRNQRAENYQNIYDILMDNVQKAKEKLQPLGEAQGRSDAEEETDRRILRQKMEFDNLLKLYLQENRVKENKKLYEQRMMEKQSQRESKIQMIKEKKFEEELLNQQKSLMYKRNAQQVRLCQKVYKLASELEKNKLLAEKREFKENQIKKKHDKKKVVDAIESYYKDRITMLKERIENEKFERKIAHQAQSQALLRMKSELNGAKKKEIDRYLLLLKQEDQKYDFDNTNLQKIEQQIVKLYKK